MFKDKSQRQTGAAIIFTLASALLFPLAKIGALDLIWLFIAMIVLTSIMTLVTK